MREALHLLLKTEGCEATLAASPDAVLAAVASRRFDVALIDLNYTRDTTSGMEGLELLARVRALDPSLPVVVMTAWGTIDLAVAAMQRGAADFVTKPWDNAQLMAALRARARTSDTAAVAPTDAVARDLGLARTAQERLLPGRAPRLSTLTCAARCVESGAVGGDSYDFLDLGPHRVGLAVADVSGKGIAAAIVMAHLNAMLRSLTPPMQEDLPRLARKINALLLDAAAPQHYVTFFLAIYDDRSRVLRYVNCGHVPPVLCREDGRAEWLSSTAPAVGLLEDFQAQEGRIPLLAGDALLAYTDGMTEASHRCGEEFGAERLLALLRQSAKAEPDFIVARLLEARRAFASDPQQDDVTVLVVKGCPRGSGGSV